MQDNEIVERVRALYPEAVIEVKGEDCNFEMLVVGEAFEGMGLLARQKSILALFKSDIQSGSLHALSVTAHTPAEQAAKVGDSLIRLTS